MRRNGVQTLSLPHRGCRLIQFTRTRAATVSQIATYLLLDKLISIGNSVYVRVEGKAMLDNYLTTDGCRIRGTR